MEIAKYKQIIDWAKDLDNVFTIRDLEIAFSKKSEASLYRSVKSLVSAGELVKVKRGIYARPDAELAVISNRIFPDSYISTGNILAKNTIIGSVPARRVQAIKVGVPRTFRCPLGTIEYLSIKSELFFGFEKKDKYLVATPEKAFLDTCYFYYKGKKFSFNLDSDINFDLLKFEIINSYLKKYDQRFVTFFTRNWIENEK